MSDIASARIMLEICTGDPAGIEAAFRGGADRIELCVGLAEGGLTPSQAIMEYSCRRIPTNILIRPRSGDFIYSPDEVSVMEKDIEIAVMSGAKGIVIGALTPEGNVDKDVCRKLLAKCTDFENTFHRAFDLTADPFQALEDIIELGFSRILTSGQAENALAGASLIKELKHAAGDRIRLIAGAGVSPENACEILRQSEADEIHASARSLLRPAMAYSSKAVMGRAEDAQGMRLATDEHIVASIRRNIAHYEQSLNEGV